MDELRDLAQLESRITSVQAIEQVMRAVWALARAQHPQALEAVSSAGEHLAWVEEVVDRLAGPPQPAPEQATLWVVLGPERSFCGSLARQVLEAIPEGGALGLVGRRLVDMAATEPGLDARVRFRLPGAAAVGELNAVAQEVARAILANSAGLEVTLLYPTARRPGLARRRVLAGARAPLRAPPETFSPPEVVLEAAVSEVAAGQLVVGLAETLLTEIEARIAASEAARKVCEGQLKELGDRWRVMRQERITEELVELSAARLGEVS
jgi:F-type H+-transporting ATPase subunit gamma